MPARPAEPTAPVPQRWLPILNADSIPIPPGGACRVTGLDDDGFLTVARPDLDGTTKVLFNGRTPVAVGGVGRATMAFPCLAAYANDALDGEGPAHGETWGTVADEWFLASGVPGFIVIGDGVDGLCNVVPAPGIAVGESGGDPVLNVTRVEFDGASVTDDGDGQVTVTVSGGGGSGLTVGSTTVASGTATRVLYDNAGTLGEYAISGTGSVVMTNSPTLVTPALGVPSSGTLTNCTGLPNAGLVNSSLTVTAGTGLSGGGSVALGASATLNVASTIPQAETIKLTDSATNAQSATLTIAHNSSGTPAAGFGSATIWELHTTTTTDTNAFDLIVQWATATHASRKARATFSAYDTAARECLRMEASGSAPMLGFYGASAVVQGTGDLGTFLVLVGLMSGTPTFSAANITGIFDGNLKISDTDDSHSASIVNGSNLTANRTLTIKPGDADRTLDISAASIVFTTVGAALANLTNPGAVSYLKIAADNSVSTRTASQMLGDLGGAASGANTDITSVLLSQTGLVVKGGNSNALTLKPNETLTGARTLNLKVNDASRTLDMGGNVTTAADFATSGAFAVTLTATASTNVTLPTSGTLIGTASTGAVGAAQPSGDQTTTSTTLGGVSGLSIAVTANKKYLVKGYIRMTGTPSGGSRLAVNGPSGSCDINITWHTSATVFATERVTTLNTSMSGTLSTISPQWVQIEGTFTCGASGGNFTIQFKSVTGGNTTTVAGTSGMSLTLIG